MSGTSKEVADSKTFLEGTTSIKYLKGVGPKLAARFSKSGISTLEDALYYLPRTFEDRRRATPINEITPGMSVVVKGVIAGNRWIKGQFEAILKDEGGCLTLHWFHTHPGLGSDFAVGLKISVYGEVRQFQGRLQMNHPEYEVHEGDKVQGEIQGSVFPVYSLPEGLTQKTVRKVVRGAVEKSTLEEVLPFPLLERLRLCHLKSAIELFHCPVDVPSAKNLKEGRDRLVFEEFFVFQLAVLMSRDRFAKAKALPVKNGLEFLKKLPFELTEDQKIAIKEVSEDLMRTQPMARLLQGDVGSGKTVVAFTAASIAGANGYQSVLMAPTEILARQHYRLAQSWLPHLQPELIVSGSSKESILKVADGQAKLVVGTHAVFQEGVGFKNLGVVVIDEQHRFGVRQRQALMKKAKGLLTPHLLMMTATPIPRTLSLTLYGELNSTIIRQKPKARRPIRTRLLRNTERRELNEAIRHRIQRGEQAYVIYPLIDPSDTLELKSATEMFESMSLEFKEFKVGLVHGRLEEKNLVLEKFVRGEIQILVATTVVEVGIDVPNATLMVIEHSERLGLSQLHQLRGRVGRGNLESECILVSRTYTKRLNILLRTEDGFEIAEEDLRLRGPGEFLGTRQSGLPGFRVGDVVRDAELLEKAYDEASAIVTRDPSLDLPENTLLKKLVTTRWKHKFDNLSGG